MALARLQDTMFFIDKSSVLLTRRECRVSICRFFLPLTAVVYAGPEGSKLI